MRAFVLPRRPFGGILLGAWQLGRPAPPLRVTTGQWAPLAALHGPVDEGQDRGPQCVYVLPLVLLQTPDANEAIDVRYV